MKSLFKVTIKGTDSRGVTDRIEPVFAADNREDAATMGLAYVITLVQESCDLEKINVTSPREWVEVTFKSSGEKEKTLFEVAEVELLG